MSFGAPASNDLQPDSFEFTPDNKKRAETIIARYPAGREHSAVIPLLDLAQRQHDNWLPRAAMDYVADLLGVPRIRAYEVASFYTMFNKAPVGRHLIQVCTTTPCWLCGSGDILRAIKEKTGLKPGEHDKDGMFSVVEVECLGACVNAPMVQINDDYFEDLDHDRMAAVIDALRRGEAPPIGSQTGRRGSQAQNGPTTLQAWREAMERGEPPPDARRAEPAEAAVTPDAETAPKTEVAKPAKTAPAKPKRPRRGADGKAEAAAAVEQDGEAAPKAKAAPRKRQPSATRKAAAAPKTAETAKAAGNTAAGSKADAASTTTPEEPES